MRFRYDPTSGALYFRLREGSIEETLELPSPGVYMDVNETGEVMGLEFLSLQEFVMFLSGFGGEVDLPEQVEPEILEGQMRLASEAEPGSALASEIATSGGSCCNIDPTEIARVTSRRPHLLKPQRTTSY